MVVPYKKEIKRFGADKNGYVIFCDVEHPLADKRGRVFYHRHVMSLHLGRWVTSEEEVHHINENPSDNRIENLHLFASKADHSRHHKPPPDPIRCEKCKKSFVPDKPERSKYCSPECSAKGRQKFEVTREKLKELLDEKTPMTKIGKMYGVSNNAVKKRAKKFGLI